MRKLPFALVRVRLAVNELPITIVPLETTCNICVPCPIVTKTVLDIGSGGGLDSFIAAKRVGPTGRVIGVDMTPAMLQRARESAKNAGFTNITFRHAIEELLG